MKPPSRFRAEVSSLLAPGHAQRLENLAGRGGGGKLGIAAVRSFLA